MVSADAFAPAGGAAIEMGVTTSANATTSIDRSRGEKMRYAFIVLLVLLCSVTSAAARRSNDKDQVDASLGVGSPPPRDLRELLIAAPLAAIRPPFRLGVKPPRRPRRPSG